MDRVALVCLSVLLLAGCQESVTPSLDEQSAAPQLSILGAPAAALAQVPGTSFKTIAFESGTYTYDPRLGLCGGYPDTPSPIGYEEDGMTLSATGGGSALPCIHIVDFMFGGKAVISGTSGSTRVYHFAFDKPVTLMYADFYAAHAIGTFWSPQGGILTQTCSVPVPPCSWHGTLTFPSDPSEGWVGITDFWLVTSRIAEPAGETAVDNLRLREGPVELLVVLERMVVRLHLPDGTAGSLNALLDAFSRALLDANERNDAAAIGTLDAFVLRIRSLRGEQLAEADADALVALALEIRSLVL